MDENIIAILPEVRRKVMKQAYRTKKEESMH